MKSNQNLKKYYFNSTIISDNNLLLQTYTSVTKKEYYMNGAENKFTVQNNLLEKGTSLQESISQLVYIITTF